MSTAEKTAEKTVDPKTVAAEFRKVQRRCRGQRPEFVEPGTAIAARLKALHGIEVTKTLDVNAELSRLFLSGDKDGARKFDEAVRREWCQVTVGSPKCNEDITEAGAKLIESGKAGLDGLEFEVECPKCGCVSRHSIALL